MCWMKVRRLQSADVNVLLNATYEGSVLFSNVLMSFMRISSWHRLMSE